MLRGARNGQPLQALFVNGDGRLILCLTNFVVPGHSMIVAERKKFQTIEAC